MFFNITNNDVNIVKKPNNITDEEFLELNPNFIKKDIIFSDKIFRKFPVFKLQDNEIVIDEYESRLKACLYFRKAEYSKLNQMEMMYDDKVNGTDTWGEAIQAIKEKYPKPE